MARRADLLGVAPKRVHKIVLDSQRLKSTPLPALCVVWVQVHAQCSTICVWSGERRGRENKLPSTASIPKCYTVAKVGLGQNQE